MRKIVVVISSLLIGLSACVSDCPKDRRMIVASYNLRFNNPDDSINAWPNRKAWVRNLRIIFQLLQPF